jgi:hypothetical protein
LNVVVELCGNVVLVSVDDVVPEFYYEAIRLEKAKEP